MYFFFTFSPLKFALSTRKYVCKFSSTYESINFVTRKWTLLKGRTSLFKYRHGYVRQWCLHVRIATIIFLTYIAKSTCPPSPPPPLNQALLEIYHVSNLQINTLRNKEREKTRDSGGREEERKNTGIP